MVKWQTVSEYAKEKGITPAKVYYQIKKGTINWDNQYVFDKNKKLQYRLVVNEIKKPKEGDTKYKEEIICPYCGYIEESTFDSYEGENQCGNCDEEYYLEIIHTIEYSTSMIRKEA